MAQPQHAPTRNPRLAGISREEEKSVTHSDFWIPEAEREIYKRALKALNEAAVPYVVAGAYAIHVHTGIYRDTKDLDILVEPSRVAQAMGALKMAGFSARLEQPHWLAKAVDGEHFVDIIYGMGNGLAAIDSDWYRYSRPAILAATPVRVAPAEELLWHRLFISERHRHDMADIVHLMVSVGRGMDWRRLVDRMGAHWPLLLAQAQMCSYVYPELADGVPAWVMDELLERARDDVRRSRTGERITRGTLVSRFSFQIDVNEWGFRNLALESVRAREADAEIRELAASEVWDDRSQATRDYDRRFS